MTYSIAGSVVINSSGQIDWSRIINKPTYIASVGGRVINTGSGSITVSSSVALEIVGTKLNSVKTNVLGNCTNCNCNCSDSGSSG